jgi:hypothetical protein
MKVKSNQLDEEGLQWHLMPTNLLMYSCHAPHTQVDQMSLLKNRPKCSPTHFMSKLIQNFYRGKKLAKNRGSFCRFENFAQSKTIAQKPKLVT